MVKAHLNKKRIRLERLKEERMGSEEQNNEDGQKKSQVVEEETKPSENETQPANTINEKGNCDEGQGETQDLNEKEQKTHVTELESDHRKINKKVDKHEDGNPKEKQNNDVTGSHKSEQNNDVTSGTDSNLNRLTTVTITVDPQQDQCVLNDTEYYLPIAREQKIKYKRLITVKEDPSLLNDKAPNNGASVKTHSDKNYQDLRSKLKDDESVQRSENIGGENFKGGDGTGREVTTGVNLGPVRQKKARVLEVRKDTRAEPRVRERSSEQLITDSAEKLNGPEKHKETSDDNHGGIHTNTLRDVVTKRAQSNEACAAQPMTEDPNNQIVCVVTSLGSPKQSDRSGRQTGLITLSVTHRHKAKKPKSLRPIITLPAITENEERGPLRKQRPDNRNNEDVKNMGELTQPSKDGQNVKIGVQRNAPSFLSPLKLTNGKLEKQNGVRVTKYDDVLPRLNRSLDFVSGYLEREDDIKTTAGSIQSLTAVELNSLRRKRERIMRKKILDEETVTVYQKNSKGQVVPSGIPFRRNVFAPPNDTECRIRKETRGVGTVGCQATEGKDGYILYADG